MANDKKNINELVTDDDDATAELEALVLHPAEADVELESAANTAGFSHGKVADPDDNPDITALRADLRARGETIDRLEFELAQLSAKWLGLEAEVKSREQVIVQLHAKHDRAATSLKRKQGLLKKRDQQIKALRLEIRERNENFRQLQEQFDVLGDRLASREKVEAPDDDGSSAVRRGQLASNELAVRELRQRCSRLEFYSDQLRQQLQDRESEATESRNSHEVMEHDLLQATNRIVAQKNEIADLNEQNEKLSATIETLNTSHADEIRMIRFELGEAQETVSQHELLTEQLASDLVETRTYRVELENMLNATEESNKTRIEKLEKENRQLRREAADVRRKLDTKNEAINCLISELARKSHQIESIEDTEAALGNADSRPAERADSQGPGERDRISRVLIGSIDNQEVRFPLFKDRLTIGRTEQNDIQLKAAHISRRHAVIVTEGSATRVIDWGSKNGVYVNSERVTEHFLRHGDIVSVGTAEFRYEERAKRDQKEN
jgi:chromosome segregation ATPase